MGWSFFKFPQHFWVIYQVCGIRNYTDNILFGLAREQYTSLHPNKAGCIKFVVVGDDVAVGRSQGEIVGKYQHQQIKINCMLRGLAETVLVHRHFYKTCL